MEAIYARQFAAYKHARYQQRADTERGNGKGKPPSVAEGRSSSAEDMGAVDAQKTSWLRWAGAGAAGGGVPAGGAGRSGFMWEIPWATTRTT